MIANFFLQANRHVGDLFIDLQDGLNLISLLEVLSGDQLVNVINYYECYENSFYVCIINL